MDDPRNQGDAISTTSAVIGELSSTMREMWGERAFLGIWIRDKVRIGISVAYLVGVLSAGAALVNNEAGIFARTGDVHWIVKALLGATFLLCACVTSVLIHDGLLHRTTRGAAKRATGKGPEWIVCPTCLGSGREVWYEEETKYVPELQVGPTFYPARVETYQKRQIDVCGRCDSEGITRLDEVVSDFHERTDRRAVDTGLYGPDGSKLYKDTGAR